MKILLTGANGYIGKRLLPLLIRQGHDVVALVRSPSRLKIAPEFLDHVEVYIGDLMVAGTLNELPKDIDAAYYLVHSMARHKKNFMEQEKRCAENFVKALEKTKVQQIIYLGGIANADQLSPHLLSRRNVEDILGSSEIPLTILRAGIIFGAGSASFEIIRDLVEKLPVMVAPKWVATKSQPIAVIDVLFYLTEVLGNRKCFNETFDIGGPDRMSYKEMLYRFAKLRGLKRYIIQVPVLTPKLSSYWLFFVTSTNFYLAQALVESLKCEAVCENERIQEIIPHKCLGFEEAMQLAFTKIEQNDVISSWKDAMSGSSLDPSLSQYFEIPKHGCLSDIEKVTFKRDPKDVIDRVWKIGGNNGWYYMDWAWEARGLLDLFFGGVGLRRGRTSPVDIHEGDSLDFWRVLVANKEAGRLLLYAEMKVPGEAWLEFKVNKHPSGGELVQTATFRPRGVLGRLYWYGLLPFHRLIFTGMATTIAQGSDDSRSA